MGATWSNLWRAIWDGLLLAAIPFLLYTFADLFIANRELPKLRRGPHVWLYYWPTVFWSHGENLKDKDEIGTFLINLLVYSAIAFAIARLRKKSIAGGTPNVIN